MDEELITHIFVQWLASKDLLDQWLTNAVGTDYVSVTSSTYIHYSDLINSAFTWNISPEGAEFWVEIDIQWDKLYKELEDMK